MFIPVPIKSKIFCTWFSFSRFVFGVSDNLFLAVVVSHIAHVGGAL
jgi:hypothetical protein